MINQQQPITVGIIEPTEPYRESLTTLLKRGRDNCWAAAGLEELNSRISTLYPPDVIVLNSMLLFPDGMLTLRQLNSRFNNVRVIIHLDSCSDEEVYRLLKIGAAGYVAKSGGLNDLTNAVNEVGKGYTYICPLVASKIVRFFCPQEEVIKATHYLSAREKQVVVCIMDGLGTKFIAEQLNLQTETVRGYIKNIFFKMGVNSKIQLMQKLRQPKNIK